MRTLVRNLTFCCFIITGLGLHAQPVVDLGADSVACGGILLDAGNAGASYLWSTGETTQTILAQQSDTIWVDVTDGSGTGSDTIIVEIVPEALAASALDTSFCGAGVYTLEPTHPNQTLAWFRSDSASSPFLLADRWENTLIDSSVSYYVQGVNTSSVFNVGYNTSPPQIQPGTRGLTFDVFVPVNILTVLMYPEFADTVEIFLEDGTGTQLFVKKEFIAPNGGNGVRVPLLLEILPGVDYRLLARTVNGARLGHVPNNAGLPISLFDWLTIKGDQVANSTKFSFLFDWEVARVVCQDDSLTIVDVQVLEAPQIELGDSRSVCEDSILLDASYPGSIYNWSTGATDSTIVVDTSGEYSVSVDLAGCVVNDTVDLLFIESPISITDTSFDFCEDETITLIQSTQGGEAIWYDSSLSEILHIGDTFANLGITDTTEYKVFSARFSDPISKIGFSGPPAQFQLGTRGITFDAHKDFILRSVLVRPQIADSINIFLEDESGAIIYSETFYVEPNQGNGVRLPLLLDVPAGDGLRLLANTVNGGRLGHVPSNANHPYEIPGLLTMTGDQGNDPSKYSFLFDWEVAQGVCMADMPVTVRANLLPAPTVSLGLNRVICDPQFTLDATNPLATYEWNDGSTDSTLLISASDTFSVTVSLGTCITADTVVLEFVPPTLGGNIQDTVICGREVLDMIVVTDESKTLWYPNGLTDIDEAFFEGDTLTRFIVDTSVFYYRTLNTGIPQQVGYAPAPISFQTQARGVRFDAYAPFTIEQVSMYASTPTSVRIYLEDSQGSEIASKTFELELGFGAENLVPVYMDVPLAGAYTLYAESQDGTPLGHVPSSVNYPFEAEGIVSLIADHTGSTDKFSYLFDWRISRGVCATMVDSILVSPQIPLDMVDSVYTCDSTLLDVSLPQTSVLWNTGATTPVLDVDSQGMYVAFLSNVDGCLVKDSTFVEIPQGAGLPDDGVLCGLILTTSYDSTSSFLWNTGDTTATIVIDSVGTYSVTIEEPRGCVLVDSIVITGFSEFPSPNLPEVVVECDSAIILVDSLYNGYLWSTGDTTQSIVITSSGQYSVVVSNENGCTGSDTVSAFIPVSPVADFFLPDTVISPTLTVNFVNLSSIGQSDWSFGDGNESNLRNPTHTYTAPGEYCVELVLLDNVNNCGADTVEKCFTLVEELVSIQRPEDFPVRLYPSPARESLQVEVAEGVYTLEIVDVQGRKYAQYASLRSDGRILLSVGDLPTGLYLLRLTSEKGYAARPFIKQ